MFDRPSDNWYIYMRPFRVALLLQMRKLQHTTYLQGEKVVKDMKDEKDNHETENNEKQTTLSTP